MQARFQELTRFNRLGIPQHGAGARIHGNGIAAGEHLFRTEQAQTRAKGLDLVLSLTQMVTSLLAQPALSLFEHFTPLPDKNCWSDTRQASGKRLPGPLLPAQTLVDAPGQAGLEIVQALESVIEAPARMQPAKAMTRLAQEICFVREPPANQLAETCPGFGHELATRKHALGDDLRGRTGSSGPYIGHKITDS